jgi:hypothetical protein
MKSLANEYKGYLKAAGLFFSNKKCPTQEKPYPEIGINKSKNQFVVIIAKINNRKTKVVPTK